MSLPTVVVTGAAGFAGRHLLDRLAGTAHVVAWCRPGGRTGDNVRHNTVTWHEVDVTDRAAVDAAIDRSRPSKVFHLAGAASVAASWTSAVPYLRVNVLGTEHILYALARHGHPCRVVVVTSAQIYAMSDDAIGEDARLLPQSPYGLSKLAQDRLALAASAGRLDVMVARPFNHIGPGQTADFAVASFARQIARIERGLAPAVISVGNLETRRDMTDVRDVVDAYVRIVDGGRAGRAYNVCSGRVWRMRDLLDELLAAATVPITIETDPARFRPIDVPVVQGDPSRLVSELGWTPHITCEQTLRDTLEAWRTVVAREAAQPAD